MSKYVDEIIYELKRKCGYAYGRLEWWRTIGQSSRKKQSGAWEQLVTLICRLDGAKSSGPGLGARSFFPNENSLVEGRIAHPVKAPALNFLSSHDLIRRKNIFAHARYHRGVIQILHFWLFTVLLLLGTEAWYEWSHDCQIYHKSNLLYSKRMKPSSEDH